MKEVEYKCYTNKGSWKITAIDDHEAFRKALWFCWRDGEDFDKLECKSFGEHYILRISVLDLNSQECWTI